MIDDIPIARQMLHAESLSQLYPLTCIVPPPEDMARIIERLRASRTKMR
jgi:hypothetical protein